MSDFRAWLAPILVALTVLAVYGPAAQRAEFVQDDAPAFLQHPAVQWPVDLAAIIRAPYFGDADHAYIRLSRPLATLSFAVEKGAGLDSSRARHLTDLLLYALACAWLTTLVYRLAVRWHLHLAARLTALFAGLWFALHPAHVEVVLQVAYRPELLALLFLLAAFEVLLAFRLNQGSLLRLVLGTLAFAAALWSKEQPLMLLPVALLWALARPGLLRRFAPLLLAWTLVALAWLAWRHWLFGPLAALPISEADNPLAVTSTTVRILTALALSLRALSHLVWPVDLAPDYTFNAWPPVMNVNGEVVGGALLLGAMVIAVIFIARRARRNPLGDEHDLAPRELGLLAVVWALLTWMPVSNLLFASTTLFADRLLFAPSVALCLGVPLAVALHLRREDLPLHRVHRAVAALLAVVTLAVSLMETPANAAAWTNDLALYTRGVRLQPQSLRMNHNLAYTLMRRGQLPEARYFLGQALLIRPADLDALALGFQLANAERRCDDGLPLARTLATVRKAAVQARTLAVGWATACHRWPEGWAAIRVLSPQRLAQRQRLDGFALGVAAGADPEALAWARHVEADPWQSPDWALRGIAAAEQGGRPLAALQHLVDLARTHADIADLPKTARALCERHRQDPDASAMLALLRATWPDQQ